MKYNKKLHICHIFWWFHFGGTEILALNIMNRQVAMGHKVTLLVMNDDVQEEIKQLLNPSIEIITFHRSEDKSSILKHSVIPFLRVNTWLLLHRPQMLHMHTVSMPKGIKAVGHRHKLLTVHYTLSKAEDISSVPTVVGISDSVCDYIRHDLLSPHAPVRIYNGIELGEFVVKEPTAADVVETRDAKKKKWRMVMISRLVISTKGQDLVLEAMRQLIDKGYNLHVDFIGEGVDAQALKELTAKLGLEEHAHWLGYRDRTFVLGNLHTYDALLQPSRNEPFGLTIAEGMAAGVPVITSDVQGAYEVIAYGRYGKAFAGSDADALAEVLEHVINHYNQAMQTAAEARTYALENFTADKMVAQYMALYDRVLAGDFPNKA